MRTPLYQVDAFTDRPFTGNPAGVCVLDQAPAGPAGEAWQQQVAAEVNVSETAFVSRRPLPEGLPAIGSSWDLRWFTPAVEVDLCGHATLAAAHVLWTSGRARGAIALQTASGRLVATAADGWITVDMPAEPADAEPAPRRLLAALGLAPVTGSATAAAANRAPLGPAPRWTGRNRLDWLIELADVQQVQSLEPDFDGLRTLGGRGAVVTAPAGGTTEAGGPDFVSRAFYPAVGIDEDPVTGSAHCALAPHWSGRLRRDLLEGRQLSRRGGTVRCRVAGQRVELSGQAVTVLEGTLLA